MAPMGADAPAHVRENPRENDCRAKSHGLRFPRMPPRKRPPVVDSTTERGYQVIRHKTGHSQVIGYARVSTRDQNLDVQLAERAAAGCCRIYAEKVSSQGHRPGWAALMGDIRKGDTVVVVRLDRIGRKLAEVVATCDLLCGEGVYVRALAQQMDTRSVMGAKLMGLFAWLAETERNLTVERTIAGLEHARKRGAAIGRPSVITPARVAMASKLRAEHYSTRKIAEAMQIGEGTVRKALELAEQNAPQKRQLRIEGT
jgi:DNA invertase Pin-like site-specific DNA recombinase